MRRFAAKLLFQFRVDIDEGARTRRVCEERIINFYADTPSAALKTAKSRGITAQYDFNNANANRVFFEFVGIMDLLELGPEADADEVWYDVYERITPMERRATFVPSENILLKKVQRT